MRVWLAVAMTVVLGSALGVFTAWWELSDAGRDLGPRVPGVDAALLHGHSGGGDGPSDGVPKLELLSPLEFDFGTMEIGKTRQRTYTVRNSGDGTLRFTREPKTTCSCAVGKMAKMVIPPGQQTEISLSWSAKKFTDSYRHAATFYTNDPRMKSFTLTVVGRVIEPIRVVPGSLVLSNIVAGESKTAEALLVGYRDQPFEVVEFQWVYDETAQFFEVRNEPCSPDELAGFEGAQHGQKLHVTVNPGLPLGDVLQTLRVVTDLDDVPGLIMPIHGRVTSDISFSGPGNFSSAKNQLHFGMVKQQQGAESTLYVLVKGPHREQVELRVGERSPADVLEAEFGEVREINQGVVRMFPLTVRVRPGARPVLLMGAEPGKLGKIVIETTHPDVPQVPLYVRFAVEG